LEVWSEDFVAKGVLNWGQNLIALEEGGRELSIDGSWHEVEGS